MLLHFCQKSLKYFVSYHNYISPPLPLLRAMAGDTSLSVHYAFCGMQHIFDQHRDAVNVIKFANNDKTKLACGSRDGTLSVFSLESEPPSLSCLLRGHQKEVHGE